MTRLLDRLSGGGWLTEERLRTYPAIMLAMTAIAVILVLIVGGGALPSGAPFGSDFVSYWIAAREALAGHPLVPYERTLFEPAQAEAFPNGGFFAFFYPPHYLAYMLPLGLMPYYPALAVWMVASFAVAVWVLARITGELRQTLILALAFPATFLTIAHGQNAFLSAALFAGGLWLLPARPVLAGILFGLLTFKPQLGLLIPLALLASGQWRAIASAAATLAVLVLSSAVLFGVEVWQAFIAQGSDAMATLTFGIVAWEKMISTYAALRVAGVGHAAAMAVQVGVSLAVAMCVVRAWVPSGKVTAATRNALLLTGALISTPFGLNYDLFLLAPAIAFLAHRGFTDGFLPFEKTAMAALFVAPFAVLAMMGLGVPIAPPLLIAFFALLLHRALYERMAEPQPALEQPAE